MFNQGLRKNLYHFLNRVKKDLFFFLQMLISVNYVEGLLSFDAYLSSVSFKISFFYFIVRILMFVNGTSDKGVFGSICN